MKKAIPCIGHGQYFHSEYAARRCGCTHFIPLNKTVYVEVENEKATFTYVTLINSIYKKYIKFVFPYLGTIIWNEDCGLGRCKMVFFLRDRRNFLCLFDDEVITESKLRRMLYE